jgi:hypothetical protein
VSIDSFSAALESRNDLNKYGGNRILLFALEINKNIDDIHALATDILTDGHDDKKCDLVYINREDGHLIFAQSYTAHNEDKLGAPANKASDLNTAAGWLFSKNFDNLPDPLRSAAEEIDDALSNSEIKSIEIWYAHNLPESTNVERELKQVEKTVSAIVRNNYPEVDIENIKALEVGRKTLESWYRGSKTPILISETFTFNTTGGFSTEGANWKAYSTSVPAKWLRDMYHKHGRELFSANVRDYLGSRKSDKNINHNIKRTAKENPLQFWVFNNGITALVNDFVFDVDNEAGIVEISGIAIVNGAQTTGALGSVEESELDEVFVSARFVKCNDPDTVQQIIRYNNSQNKIEAADFRSNDQIQSRLRDEFSKLPTVVYLGGRRGGESDRIGRVSNLIPSYTAAQALAAFHQEPEIAYNRKSKIWEEDAIYSKLFSDRTSARHILFCYSLLRSIEEHKLGLKDILPEEQTQAQIEQLEFYRMRGSSYLLVSAISACLETIVGKAIHNHFGVVFNRECSFSKGISNWKTIVEMVSPIAWHLSEALAKGQLKNRAVVKNSIKKFRSIVETLGLSNTEVSKEFSKRVEIL